MAAPNTPFDGTLPAGEVTGYRLNGVYNSRRESSAPGYLQSTGILEARPLTARQNTRLRAVLARADSFGGQGARCFHPGLGFAAGNEAERVEVLICLECRWAYFFHENTRLARPLSDVGRERLAKLYAELFPDANPDEA